MHDFGEKLRLARAFFQKLNAKIRGKSVKSYFIEKIHEFREEQEMKRKVISAILIAALALTTIAGSVAMVSAEETAAKMDRVSGSNRFQTAINVANELKTELGVSKFSTVVVANSDDYADALSATALATKYDAPVLVVNKNNESTIRNYINSNLKAGGKVYLIGGTAAISQNFQNSLKNYSVERLGGSDRFETNLKVLKKLNLTGKDTILVAYGLNFADALSAASTGEPIMLVNKKLSANQEAFVRTLGGNDTFYLIGGTSAIQLGVENTFKNVLKVGTVTRIKGDDRYETSSAVARAFYPDAEEVLIASGDNFPDGLTGGVLAAAKGAPLMLVNKYNTADAAKYVKDKGVGLVTAIGGTTAITQTSHDEVAGKAEPTTSGGNSGEKVWVVDKEATYIEVQIREEVPYYWIKSTVDQSLIFETNDPDEFRDKRDELLDVGNANWFWGNSVEYKIIGYKKVLNTPEEGHWEYR